MGSWHRMLHLRQMHAAGRRGIDSWTRLDTTSCQSPGYVFFFKKKKNPTHGARHGPSMRQCMYYKAHEIAEESPKETTQNYSGQMEQRWQIPQIFLWCRVDRGKSHSIRRNRIWRPLLHCDKTRKKSEREVRETSIECRGYTRTIESAQWLETGEADMQNTVPRAYSNHWKWKQTYPSRAKQARQRRHQQFVGLEAYDYRLEASTGWRYYPSSTTHSSSSSPWQPSSDLWSTWNWDSWKSSSWTEQCIFSKIVPVMSFRLPEI